MSSRRLRRVSRAQLSRLPASPASSREPAVVRAPAHRVGSRAHGSGAVAGTLTGRVLRDTLDGWPAAAPMFPLGGPLADAVTTAAESCGRRRSWFLHRVTRLVAGLPSTAPTRMTGPGERRQAQRVTGSSKRALAALVTDLLQAGCGVPGAPLGGGQGRSPVTRSRTSPGRRRRRAAGSPGRE